MVLTGSVFLLGVPVMLLPLVCAPLLLPEHHAVGDTAGARTSAGTGGRRGEGAADTPQAGVESAPAPGPAGG